MCHTSENTKCVERKSGGDPFREDGSGPADTQSQRAEPRDAMKKNVDRIPTPAQRSFFALPRWAKFRMSAIEFAL